MNLVSLSYVNLLAVETAGKSGESFFENIARRWTARDKGMDPIAARAAIALAIILETVMYFLFTASTHAAGISEAMNCAGFGLLSAIPALIAFWVLMGRTQSLINDINETSVSVLNLIVSNRDKFKNMNISSHRDDE